MDEFGVFFGILANFFRVYWYTTTPPWPTLTGRSEPLTGTVVDKTELNLWLVVTKDPLKLNLKCPLRKNTAALTGNPDLDFGRLSHRRRDFRE